MAKTTPKDPAPESAPEPAQLKEDGEGTPAHRVWIQPTYGEVLLPADAFNEHEPLIHIGGKDYRHVAETPEGAWIYRSDK